MAGANPGWYNDGSGTMRWWDGDNWTEKVQPPEYSGGMSGFGGIGDIFKNIQDSAEAGAQPRPASAGMSYVVLQVILKEKLWGTGSGNLTELEKVINRQASMGYRLHTISTSSSGSKGLGGGDRIQATMVFERIN